MKCPFCSNRSTTVLATRTYQNGMYVLRRRECMNPNCKKRFSTYEATATTDKSFVSAVNRLAKRGFTYEAIAEILGIQRYTVASYIKLGQHEQEQPKPPAKKPVEFGEHWSKI